MSLATTSSPSPSISPYDPAPSTAHHHHPHNAVGEMHNVRSGNDFWTAGHNSNDGTTGFSAIQIRHMSGQSVFSSSACALGSIRPHANDVGDDSNRTEIAAGPSNDESHVAQGALYAGSRGQLSGK